MVWPPVAQEYAVKTAYKYSAGRIFSGLSPFDFHPALKQLLDLMPLEKSPDQSTASKPGQILAGKFFLHTISLRVVIGSFLMYTLFHLLSASFVVLVVFCIPLFYYIWRHFSLCDYMANA